MKINMDSLAKNGFVRFRSDSSIISTLDIASAIGDISSVSGVKPVQTLMPRLEENSEKSSYSGNFGYSEFPLHTDMAHWYLPPRFFILR